MIIIPRREKKLLYEISCKGQDASCNEFLRRLEIKLYVIVGDPDRTPTDLFSNSHKTKVKGASAEIEKGNM